MGRLQVSGIKVGREVRLFSRNRVDWSERLPAGLCRVARISARKSGRPCASHRQSSPSICATRAGRCAKAAAIDDETGLSFHAFDLLQLNAADLKPKPLAERRRRLVDLVQRLDEAVPVLYLPDAFASGEELLKMCGKLRLEGICLEAAGSAVRLRSYARLDQGQVRGLERGEPLARRGVREDKMIDQTRYKAWRSGPDAELHVIG